MKREIMSSAGLEWYAEVGLAIFVIVFLLIIARVVFMSKREAEDMSHIPLEGESPATDTLDRHPTTDA